MAQLYLSVEEWLRFENEQHKLKHELIEGVVYAMAGASNRHNDVSASILAKLFQPARDHGCRAVASDQRLVIRDRTGYPDVAVEPDDGQYRRNPCLLVEVVSPSSLHRDYETKAIAYLQIASLLAYLIVDPSRNVVEVHVRDNVSEPWRSMSLPVGTSITLTCPPLIIDIADLFALVAAGEPAVVNVEYTISHRNRYGRHQTRDPSRGYTAIMELGKVWKAADVERLSPNERAELFDAQVVTDLSRVDPVFLERVRRKARVLLEARGLLEPETA